MNKLEVEMCPICIEKPTEYFTECNHGYCLECLSHLKNCALCRKSLLRNQLCIEIKCKIKFNELEIYSAVEHLIILARMIPN